MKTFQRYLSSINKGSVVEVLDFPAAVLNHLLAKFFKVTVDLQECLPENRSYGHRLR